VTQPAASNPAQRKTVNDLLEQARSQLARLDPHQALAAVRAGALLVDIRGDLQRARDGVVPGSIFIARNVLEWRCDPDCGDCDPRIGGLDRQIVLMCDQGCQSSLAAATLQELGFARATDLVGGFQGWRAAGLPVHAIHEETRCAPSTVASAIVVPPPGPQ
jgi:rhodanese-related sulfurtransferase